MKKIKIGLFGFGKTGMLVARELLNDLHFSLKWVVKRSQKDTGKFASRLLGLEKDEAPIYPAEKADRDFYRNNPVDIIIDFSGVHGYRQYEPAAQSGTKIISAISKYREEDLAALKGYAKKTAVIYSPNITLGINFLLVASQILQKITPHADIEIVEEHFRDKKEASGTAMKIADMLGLKKEKHVNSIRVGGIVGKHEIIFGLPNQTIRLIHESISKSAFGQGAIFAAKWLYDKGNGLYSMENIIMDMFAKNIPVY